MRDPYLATGYLPKIFHPNDPDYEKYTIGFKAMNLDMTCRGKHYKVGQTYTEEGPLQICLNGMHYCPKIGDIFSFYQPALDEEGSLNIRIFKVHAEGDIEVEFGPGDDPIKCAALTLRIEDEIPQEKLIKLYHIEKQSITTFTYDFDYRTTPRDYTFSLELNGCNANYNLFYNLNCGQNYGSYNIGDSNSGCHNRGSYNQGNYNYGDENYGRLNSGMNNQGNCNIGSYNMGKSNLGSLNIGDYNCGFANIGSFNKTSHAIGYFNTQSGVNIMFNKPTPADISLYSLNKTMAFLDSVSQDARALLFEQDPNAIDDILQQYDALSLPTTAISCLSAFSWQQPQQYTLRIFEKLSSYRTEAFRKLSAETKQKIEALPNFDRKIFAECTGIAETAFDD
jgi:hypothetical protein